MKDYKGNPTDLKYFKEYNNLSKTKDDSYEDVIKGEYFLNESRKWMED